MKIKLLKKDFLKHLQKHARPLRDARPMQPKREWAIGLGVALTLFIITSSVGVYVYVKNQSVEVAIATIETTPVVYRESVVGDVLRTIQDRAQELVRLKQIIVPDIPQLEVVATSTPETLIPIEVVPVLGE